jgi:hypothetical protein
MELIGNYRGYNLYLSTSPNFSREAVWLVKGHREDGGFDDAVESLEHAIAFIDRKEDFIEYDNVHDVLFDFNFEPQPEDRGDYWQGVIEELRKITEVSVLDNGNLLVKKVG